MRKVQANFWKNKRVLLTGHTGFKGSWLSIWLQSMGVDLYGLSLPPPTKPSLYELANINSHAITSYIGDIRDKEFVNSVIEIARPEIIIHMAAQPLVVKSYIDPIETFTTNIIGVVNLLEAVRGNHTVKAILNITSDKCYENKEWIWGYRENEALGGEDPYSSSKACSELITHSYRKSFFQNNNIGIATARAGNVIGGGDWAVNRLIPDIIKSFKKNEELMIRNPDATRPWQHVLEPLGGYLILLEELFNKPTVFSESWNFGPKNEDIKSVHEIAETLSELMSKNGFKKKTNALMQTKRNGLHEANQLKLDISKAISRLDWTPKWGIEKALDMIVRWEKNLTEGADMYSVCVGQINEYNQTK